MRCNHPKYRKQKAKSKQEIIIDILTSSSKTAKSVGTRDKEKDHTNSSRWGAKSVYPIIQISTKEMERKHMESKTRDNY
jgi:hypothetical protein